MIMVILLLVIVIVIVVIECLYDIYVYIYILSCFLRCGFLDLPGILGKTGNLRLPEAEVMLSQRPVKWNMHLHGVRRRSGWAHGNHHTTEATYRRLGTR